MIKSFHFALTFCFIRCSPELSGFFFAVRVFSFLLFDRKFEDKINAYWTNIQCTFNQYRFSRTNFFFAWRVFFRIEYHFLKENPHLHKHFEGRRKVRACESKGGLKALENWIERKRAKLRTKSWAKIEHTEWETRVRQTENFHTKSRYERWREENLMRSKNNNKMKMKLNPYAMTL